MRVFLYAVIGWGILFLISCGPSPVIRRDEYSLKVSPPGYCRSIIESAVISPDSGFYKLLYNKKIKEVPDGPLLIGDKYIGFRTARGRYLFYDQDTGRLACRIKKGRGYILNPAVADSLIVLVRKNPLGRIEVRNLFTGKNLYELAVNDIKSGPIIIEDRLVTGTSDGLRAYTFPGLVGLWVADLKGMIDITPIEEGGVIYCGGGRGFMAALSLVDGSILWKRQLPSAIGSALSIGTFLYVSLTDGTMEAIDKSSGATAWRAAVGFPIRGKIVECNGKVFAGCTNGDVYCLDLADGRQVWEYPTGSIITGSPVIDGETIFIGSHEGVLYRLDIVSGRLRGSYRLSGPVTTAAVVADGRAFVTSRGKRLYCFEVD